MHDAGKLAIGIILLWLAGLAFFVAFHPNGVTMPDGKAARNPGDVLKYIIAEVHGGKSDNSGFSGGGSF